eukprot:6214803-Pleurochrysis_carterae.AAC.3
MHIEQHSTGTCQETMAAARRQHLSTLALLWASAAALHPSHRVTHASQKYRLDTVRSIDVRLSEARMRGKCILVAGANGRTGAALCRELLRSQPSVQVRALVRSNEPESSSRLSYETGAEENEFDIDKTKRLVLSALFSRPDCAYIGSETQFRAEYSLRPAWALDEEEGGFAKLQVRPRAYSEVSLDEVGARLRRCGLGRCDRRFDMPLLSWASRHFHDRFAAVQSRPCALNWRYE